MSLSNFRFPTFIRYGVDSVNLLKKELDALNCNNPLLITDKSLVGTAAFERTKDALQKASFPLNVFSDCWGNPNETMVKQGVQAYKASSADGIILLGGGCAIDVGKAVGLMAHHPGNLFDYEDEMEGARPICEPIPPMVAIPTSAGTGSEVGGSSVITDDHTKRKVIIWGNELLPKIVLADPQLICSLPPFFTAATGMDALTHNLEAFLAKNYHPICDGIALSGMRLVNEHLLLSIEKPNDTEHRGGMLMASMMGAIAFQKGLGITHSCAHALSICHDTHHGHANSFMLDVCMEFNLKHCRDKFDDIARYLNLPQKGSDHPVVAWIKELQSKVNLPDVEFEANEKLFSAAVADPCHANNPVPCRKEDFVALFTAKRSS